MYKKRDNRERGLNLSMSDVCLDSITLTDYYVSLTVKVRYDKTVYIVQVCPMEGDICGYPIKEMQYIDEKKARATYKNDVKKYCK